MRKLKIIILILASYVTAFTQVDYDQVKEMGFEEFLRLSVANNFDYLIENYEVSIAEAAYTASKVFEDPELEIILPMFNEDDFSGFPTNISLEMEVPIELFGK